MKKNVLNNSKCTTGKRKDKTMHEKRRSEQKLTQLLDNQNLKILRTGTMAGTINISVEH
jgi:hypothetical protein|tara:strand:- start:208 stop:384 length:177 start_codon:yes stop_codon:yes gene_type:complete